MVIPPLLYGLVWVLVMLINATVEFTKNGSKETVAVLDADGVPGGGFGNEARRRDAYEELGECLVKIIKKAK